MELNKMDLEMYETNNMPCLNMTAMKQMEEKINKLPADVLTNLYSRQEEHARSQGLEINNQLIPFLHFPLLIKKNIIQKINDKLEQLIATILEIEEVALRPCGSAIFDRLMNSLSAGGKEMVLLGKKETDFDLLHRHRRVDAYLLDEHNIKVIEINQAAPLALHFYDTCQELAMMALDTLEIPHQETKIAPALLQWFIASYQYRYPNQFPQFIALPIEHGYPPKFSDLPKMAQRIEKEALEKYDLRLKIQLCFPYDLHLHNNHLYFGDNKVDIVWRNSVYMTQYKSDGKNLDDYLHALQHPDEFIIINSTRTWLTRNKEIFSLIWDDDIMNFILKEPNQIHEIRSMIPETYNLFYQKDKISQILHHKSDWITKPSDAGFGLGVEFGANHSQQSWHSIIQERSKISGYVFQKRVPYPTTQIYDLESGGTLCRREIEYDFCPHHINGVFPNSVLSRANIIAKNNAQKMNLVSGGYLLPIINYS